ncbi:MAG: hypothetical protein R3C20_14225 [Planctomycetaceae bacterium]
MQTQELRAEYELRKSQAELLAGGLLDIPRRVIMLTNMYLDSGRNHAFCQMAAHGALWGLSYFESGGSLGRLIARRYFYNSKEKAFRLGILREFAESFRRINRQVCIDTYAAYEFTREYGQLSAASDIVPADLLEALNQIHHASRTKKSLPGDQKRRIFETSFRNEQELTVAPGVQSAIAAFDCRIMRWLCLHPVVRFSYFPSMRYMFFRDFGCTEERIQRGIEAYEVAERVGWDHVFDSMEFYGHMPRPFFSQPLPYFEDLKSDALRNAGVAATFSRP